MGKNAWRFILVVIVLTFLAATAANTFAGEKEQPIEKEKEKYDRIAKEVGYKGLYNAGIARFLYRVKHGKEDMNSCLKTFFWSDISENDKINDGKFEAMQLLDDFIIYNLNDYQRGEIIQFTIMVPTNKGEAFLEGQTLRGKLHAYEGNITYTTIMGVERTVPVFRQVVIEEKK